MAAHSIDVIMRGHDRASAQINRVAGAVTSMNMILKRAAYGMAGYLSFRAIFGFAKSSLDEFGRMEKGTIELGSALKSLGKEAELPAMSKFSAEMQKATVHSDDAVMEMMKLGVTIGKLSGTSLTDATKAAIGLAAAFNIDTEAAMRLTSMGAAGVTIRLKKLGIEMKKGASDQEVYNEVLKRGAEGFKIAEANVDTYEGRMAQMHNAIGDMKETIGSILAGPIGAIAKHIKTWAESMVEGMNVAIFSVKNWGLTWQIVTTGIKVWMLELADRFPMLTSAIKAYIFYVGNIGKIWKLAFENAALHLITFWEDLKHAFTVVIPAYLDWFKTHWREVFTDIWNGTKTIFTNLLSNIGEFFKAVWAWFKGEGFNFEWTSLTDGFKSSLTDLPKIADREMTALEKTMTQKVDELTAQLAVKYAEILDPKATENAKAELIKLTKEWLELQKTSVIPLGSGDKGDKDKSGKETKLAALESRFLTMQPGGRMEPAVETAKNTKEQRLLQAKMLKQQELTNQYLRINPNKAVPVYLMPANL